MTITRAPEVLADLLLWIEDFEVLMEKGARSARIQWDIEGHDEPLTLLANRQGVFIVEPGAGTVPAREWLDR